MTNSYQSLFDLMLKEHGLLLTESEMTEIKKEATNNEINNFVQFISDNYSIEIPDRAIQEYKLNN